MTDDIVTRLRQCAELERPLFWRSQMVEAADEIERLRAEVARLGSFIHPIGTVMGEQAVQSE